MANREDGVIAVPRSARRLDLLQIGSAWLARHALVCAMLLVWAVLCGNAPLEAPPTFLLKWGSPGTGNGQFRYPYGIAVDENGRVYVADAYNNRVQVFSSTGEHLLNIGSYPLLETPFAVAVRRGGNVYVCDRGHHAIRVFNRAGALIATWGRAGGLVGMGPGEFFGPEGIATDDSGFVYVSDTGNERIQKLTASGVFVRMWAGPPGIHLDHPRGLAADGIGNLYCLDIGDGQELLKFTTQGEFLGVIAEFPFFDSPNYVATDRVGNVYVTDGDNHRVVKLTPEGKELTHWGPGGNDVCNFISPTGIAVDDEGNIYVGDPSFTALPGSPTCVQKFGSTLTSTRSSTWGSIKARYR